jgi:hypothetical protein
VLALLARVSDLERTLAAERDEIARLKKLPRRPILKPSGMENATQSKPPRVLPLSRRLGWPTTETDRNPVVGVDQSDRDREVGQFLLVELRPRRVKRVIGHVG